MYRNLAGVVGVLFIINQIKEETISWGKKKKKNE